MSFVAKEKLKAFIILFVLLCIFHFPICIKKYFLWEDTLYLFYPQVNYIVTSLKELRIPLWASYIFSGNSFLGDVETGIFYLPYWFLILFTKSKLSFYAFEWLLLFHLLFAGFFIFLSCRYLKMDFVYSLFSSCVFMFCGFLSLRLLNAAILQTFCWLPFNFYFLYRGFEERNFKFIAIAALGVGLMMLVGFPQVSLYVLYFLTLFFIWRILTRLKNWKFYLISFILLAVMGGLMSAIQYLPAFEYVKYTVRQKVDYKFCTTNSLHPSLFLLFIVPKLFGSKTATGTDTVYFWGGDRLYGSFWETCVFFGIIPFILSFLSFKRESRRSFRYFLYLSAGIFLLLSMGRYSPLYNLLYNILPGLNKFRCPSRMIVLTIFCASILAGMALQQLRNLKEKTKKYLWAFLAICWLFYLLLLAGAFRNLNQFTRIDKIYNNMINQSTFAIFMLTLGIIFINFAKKMKYYWLPLFVLSYFDLWWFSHNFHVSRIPAEKFFREDALVSYLKKERRKEFFRVNARIGGYMILRRNQGLISRIELIEGFTPLKLKRYANFKIDKERKLDLLNVKYRIVVDTQNMRIYLGLNKDFMPRFKFFYKYRVLKDTSEILKTLSQDEFDYRNELILEEEPRLNYGKHGENWIKVIKYEPEKIILSLYTSENGILWLSENWAPGWYAFLDDKPVKILIADYTFRAVEIPAGRHILKMIYYPKTYKIGRILSLISLILIICMIVFNRRLKWLIERKG